ncbi:MAG: hypothetical protein OEM41_04700 [Ignavibacteria bacterium]|nr:hypothetical protein [Ignavibacteria bacterium]
MKKILTVVLCMFVVGTFATMDAHAQASWVVGGRLGISIASVGGGSTTYNPQTFQFETSSATSAGLQIGFTGEAILSKVYGISSEFNINTQGGTPIEWANSFKYYFAIRGSKIKAYGDGGFSLWFFSGGPYFGLRFGGGALFPIAPKLYIPADLQLGPIFSSGSTVFYIAITSGIRYEI